MLNFDLGSAMKAKESSGKRLNPGINKAKYVGVDYDSIKIGSDERDAMIVTFDIEGYGEYKQNILFPREKGGNTRSQNGFGGENPSEMEQFMIKLTQLISALSPELGTKVESEGLKLSGSSYKQIVKNFDKLISDFEGTEIEIKLIPNSKGWPQFPDYPARINRNGELAIATRIYGHDLTLSERELKQIEAAKNAKPTDMSKNSSTSSLLNDMSSELGEVSDDEDDLPF